MPPGGRRTTAADDYRAKIEHEASRFAGEMRGSGHPAPLGDPASGVLVLVEQPVGPRVLEALRRSLQAVDLPDAYVTYASTGLLLQELLSTEPDVLAAVGPAAAAEVDDLEHPLSRTRFSEAPEGEPFPWTKGTLGLRLPALAPALDDEAAKRRFWRSFLALKALHRAP